MDNRPTFRVAQHGGVTLYCVTVPDTADGIDMLDEISRMFRHRGEQQVAGRISRIVTERKQELRSLTPGTKYTEASKQAVQQDQAAAPASPCRVCGGQPYIPAHTTGPDVHHYKPDAPARKTPRRRPVGPGRV